MDHAALNDLLDGILAPELASIIKLCRYTHTHTIHIGASASGIVAAHSIVLSACWIGSSTQQFALIVFSAVGSLRADVINCESWRFLCLPGRDNKSRRRFPSDSFIMLSGEALIRLSF